MYHIHKELGNFALIKYACGLADFSTDGGK